MKKRIVPGLIFLIFFASFVYVQASSGPTKQLRPVLGAILEALSDESLQGEAHKIVRREKIMQHVAKGFDFEEMSKRVLGRPWLDISQADKDQFIVLFTKLLENVYIGKLEAYSGQKVEYVGEKQKKDRAMVTTIVEGTSQGLAINYIMINKDDSWMVYDINIEGVSLIRNYRQQFKSILKRDTFEGLLKELAEKNSSFDKG